MVKSVLITGANSGLGKEAARQLAIAGDTEKIYLSGRNSEKLQIAKHSLEEETGKSIFEIVLIDMANLETVKSAVASLNEPIEALVMNAGGLVGTPGKKTTEGVTELFAANVLGHAVLVDELLKAEKLTKVAVYVSSEASRGIPKMGMKRPVLESSSVAEFKAISDGSFFGENTPTMETYGPVKYVGTLWMASLARKHPNIRFVSVSPGGTSGTAGADELPPVMKFVMKNIAIPLMSTFGLMHNVETGAKRYIDVLKDETYKSGHFYASKASTTTGAMVDQATIFSDLNNEAVQDNAYEAVQSFIK